HGGILFKDTPQHLHMLQEMNIKPIDLVVCNLYNFGERTVENSRDNSILDQIDIGGPTLIRAAAKNFNRVTVVVDPDDYPRVISKFPDLEISDRIKLAAKAFALIANYDIEISKYMNKISEVSTSFFDDPLEKDYFLSGRLATKLRYGENPHQSATYYISDGTPFFEHMGGPSISYNNILDINAGWNLISEFKDPSCVIIKHRTPCGVASAKNQTEAYYEALETDKIAAYGGVYIFNNPISINTATELVKMFVDVLFAPGYEEEALEILRQKEKLTILERRPGPETRKELSLIPDGFVIQDRDRNILNDDQLEFVSLNKPSKTELEILKFAWKVVKHSRSNAIAITKGTRTIGIGSGHTSRINAVKQAIEQAGSVVEGGILASDAFFPFADSIHLAAAAGIKLIITPKGSIRDDECVAAANSHNIKLVFTSVRGFKH
ncbi:MAG: bifunctional phosphoribosylaminoimidazolecarboxamide formyltransferase/IMP cyclohydrolase, partial [Candidatus Heimdallarchaeota archaeon]